MEKPEGAEIEIKGLWYKVGVHNKLFFWAVDHWQLSSFTSDEIKRVKK